MLAPLCSAFVCPLSGKIMRHPVVAGDGLSYEHNMIKEWFDNVDLTSGLWAPSPSTGFEMGTRHLVRNRTLEIAIAECMEMSTKSDMDHLLEGVVRACIQEDTPEWPTLRSSVPEKPVPHKHKHRHYYKSSSTKCAA